MNNYKQTFSIIALAFFLTLGVALSYSRFHKPVQVVEIKDSPFSVLMKNATSTFVENTDWYETKIDYPKDNTKIRDQILQIYDNYVKETQIKNYSNLTDAKNGLQINVEGEKYSFLANYKIATSSNTISYIYEVYTFTGGAHGGTDVHAFTENDKQEIIPITQILPDTSLKRVSKLAKADLLKQKAEKMKSYGNMTEKEIAKALKNDTFIDEGIQPTRDNYSVAWYDGDGVVISFGQYQVGPYVEGLYEVKIPKTNI